MWLDMWTTEFECSILLLFMLLLLLSLFEHPYVDGSGFIVDVDFICL